MEVPNISFQKQLSFRMLLSLHRVPFFKLSFTICHCVFSPTFCFRKTKEKIALEKVKKNNGAKQLLIFSIVCFQIPKVRRLTISLQ